MAVQYKGLVQVPVATLWTSLESAREIDQGAISNPVLLDSWINGLSYEMSLELCEKNLVQSQVLFGEEVLVLEERKNWVQVVVPSQSTSKDHRGYPGWLPKDQIIKKDDWAIKNGPVAIVMKKKATLYSNERIPQFLLSYQTTLPIISESREFLQVQTPNGEALLKAEEVNVHRSLESIPKGSGKEIVAAGEQFLHLPYLWGGMSSFGYDCSGFSYSMCKANGYTIPRDAHDQSCAGKMVNLEEIEIGDLLFFAYEDGKGSIHHVGIYYGEGKLIHSPNTGKSIEIIDLKETIYEKELCMARRFW
ncbi:cell wall-associated NlpC family hydrolase [Cytobacillus eiseniae]|uniref:Cell wall-associated NlpC family hydrolase n=1 Tax=Cytobacillus eiseniae TaxID=762947 RepID=A0ABS4RI79_9BACI|nr:C40 family peptidase [Cytobacillus eiseniae]MBP2242434.1 cell wall-associated NlpC family hydrolase [Cytobacillus eiseniae]